jgi:predicted MPP superfamily phosphohydrolase
MSSFFWRILGAFLLVQIVALIIWWRRLAGRPRLRIGLVIVFLLANLPWFLFGHTFFQEILPPDWITRFIIRPFITWQAGTWLWLTIAASLAVTIGILYHIPRRLARRFANRGSAAARSEPQNPDRRRFLARGARTAAWTAAFTFSAWGLARAGRSPAVVTHDLAVKNLPPALAGLKIAHLSDLHLGLWTTPSEIFQALGLTRELEPDLVVITGDLIDHSPTYSQILVQHLNALDRVPLGVFAIIGNHDIYTGADAITQALGEGGLVMLRNRHHSFLDQGLPLALIGVDDPGRQWTGSGGRLPLEKAAAGLSDDVFPILLAHRPTSFDQALNAGIPVTLCGHTHGGQFAIPGGPNLADGFYEYTHGLYRKAGSMIHVTSGLGAVGLPFRLGVPPEIAILRLVPAP